MQVMTVLVMVFKQRLMDAELRLTLGTVDGAEVPLRCQAFSFKAIGVKESIFGLENIRARRALRAVAGKNENKDEPLGARHSGTLRKWSSSYISDFKPAWAYLRP